MGAQPPQDLDCIDESGRAAQVLHPLRLRILSLASQPVSATQLGTQMGLSRQRINYHVRRLFHDGFLRRAGRRRRRNMFEQSYVASARSFLLSPEILGPVGLDWRRIGNAQSVAYLLALSSQMQLDLVRALRAVAKGGRDVSAITFKSQFRFERLEQREVFDRALREAIVQVIARYTSPSASPGGKDAPGQPFRLVLGCYPFEPERPV